MGEAAPLLALGAMPDSIWGDEDETMPKSSDKGEQSFSASTWMLTRRSQSQAAPSVAIMELKYRHRYCLRQRWKDNLASLSGTPIHKYLSLLRNIHPVDLAPSNPPLPTVDLSDIFLLQVMGGRGCCKRVRLRAGSPETSIFKRVDSQTYLQLHDDDDEFMRHTVEVWRRSSRLIANMRAHPNIQPPPKILVSVRGLDNKPVLIGHLSIFFPKGDLAAVIAEANSSGTHISQHQKAKWCHQMSLAMAHTHNVVHTFHIDIKPGNFIVDNQGDLILIDWGQSGAPATTLAPEADGTWDVNREPADRPWPATRLVYTKYRDPEGRNMPEGGGQETFNVWNVFPEWQKSCPRVTELAEVFALGRTMWMLLTQNADDFDEVEHPNDVQVTWDNRGSLPAHWIRMVNKCMHNDPDCRPRLDDVARFWERQEARLGLRGWLPAWLFNMTVKPIVPKWPEWWRRLIL